MQRFRRTTQGPTPTMHPAPEGTALQCLGTALMRAVATARSRCDAVAGAHRRRRRLEELSPEILRDIGMSREDATGLTSEQLELPFFMQSGFGKPRG